MIKSILVLTIVTGMLAGCVSGTKKPDSYINSDGTKTVIESGLESCSRSCNDSYSRCMDSRAAGDNNSGVIGPSGIYGASAECRNSLKRCLSSCK